MPGISSSRNARGADTASKPAAVNVLVFADLAVLDTGACPWGWSETCEMRPTCQSWTTILPPAACTRSVTWRQPATCSGL
jgi:hypothetical protein